MSLFSASALYDYCRVCGDAFIAALEHLAPPGHLYELSIFEATIITDTAIDKFMATTTTQETNNQITDTTQQV